MTALFTSRAQSRESDERYTPAWVFDGLALEFDTDPASPGVGDFVPALCKYTIDTDGLSRPWYGRVWLNPPFSSATAWARRFIDHQRGVFLGPVANSAWCIELMQAADLVWFMRDFPFVHPTHAGKRSSMPLFMAAIGDAECTAGLRRLATSGRHDGVLFERAASTDPSSSRYHAPRRCSAFADDAPAHGIARPVS